MDPPAMFPMGFNLRPGASSSEGWAEKESSPKGVRREATHLIDGGPVDNQKQTELPSNPRDAWMKNVGHPLIYAHPTRELYGEGSLIGPSLKSPKMIASEERDLGPFPRRKASTTRGLQTNAETFEDHTETPNPPNPARVRTCAAPGGRGGPGFGVLVQNPDTKNKQA